MKVEGEKNRNNYLFQKEKELKRDNLFSLLDLNTGCGMIFHVLSHSECTAPSQPLRDPPRQRTVINMGLRARDWCWWWWSGERYDFDLT